MAGRASCNASLQRNNGQTEIVCLIDANPNLDIQNNPDAHFISVMLNVQSVGIYFEEDKESLF